MSAVLAVGFSSIPSFIFLWLAHKGKQAGDKIVTKFGKCSQSLAALGDSIITFLGNHQWKLQTAGIAALFFPIYIAAKILLDDARLLYQLGASSLVSVLKLQLKHSTAEAMIKEVLNPVIASEELVVRDIPQLNKIEAMLKGEDSSKQYCVIAGPKGCGKSVAVAKLLKGRKYTLYVKVSNVCTSPTTLLALLWKVSKFPPNAEPAEEDLIDAFDSVRAKGEVPCVVFDVDRNQEPQVLGAVSKLAKAFLGHAVSLIVVSEANAVLAFGRDHNRISIIWMGDFSVEESQEYLRKAQIVTEDNSKAIQDFIQEFGTRPAMMRRLRDDLKHGQTISEFTRKEKLAAEMSLYKFPLKIILNELKQHPEGVKVKSFGDQVEKDVHLAVVEEVAEMAMTDSDVIYYDFNDASYKLGSPVLKKVLAGMTFLTL
jgi:hypothetical protein